MTVSALQPNQPPLNHAVLAIVQHIHGSLMHGALVHLNAFKLALSSVKTMMEPQWLTVSALQPNQPPLNHAWMVNVLTLQDFVIVLVAQGIIALQVWLALSQMENVCLAQILVAGLNSLNVLQVEHQEPFQLCVMQTELQSIKIHNQQQHSMFPSALSLLALHGSCSSSEKVKQQQQQQEQDPH